MRGQHCGMYKLDPHLQYKQPRVPHFPLSSPKQGKNGLSAHKSDQEELLAPGSHPAQPSPLQSFRE